MSVPSRKRRALSWLPSILLLLLVVAAGFVTVAVNSSWWVDPDPTAAPDQTAPNGSTLFTDAGVDYLRRTGLVVIRMDAAALPTRTLGLPADGERVVSAPRPLRVQVFGSSGALVVDAAEQVTLRTEGGELVSVEVLTVEAEGFVAAHAELAAVQELYGWSAEEVASVPDRFRAARRDQPGGPAEVTVGPGTAVGLEVTATLVVDGAAILTYTAERLE